MPPAARITDFHVCPMVNPGPVPHVGGPIAMGSPTVFTGKLPQARVGDMAICVGPPDTIVKGSSGVFVNKKPAARLGDNTAHGGVIVAGLPTVIIGETGGGGGGSGNPMADVSADGFTGGGLAALASALAPLQAETLRMAAQSGTPFCEICFKNAKPKLSPAVQKAVAEPPAKPAAPPLSPACAKLAKARTQALMAEDAYHPGTTAIPGHAYIDPCTPSGRSELAKLGLSPSDLQPSDSDFRASVYRSGNDYVVSYRGTQTTSDWMQNFKQGAGFESDHYNRAISVGKRASRGAAAQGGSVSYVGHSLGGGMASAAAVATNRPAATFNSAGLNANTVADYKGSAPPVDAYYVPGEMLSGAQDNRGVVLGGVAGLASMIGPVLGGAATGWLLGNEAKGTPVLPKAYGTRHELPSAAPPGKSWAQHNPLNKHGMDWVLSGIEHERAQEGCP